MPSSVDLAILEDLPAIKIWGESLDEIESIKSYRGKFVVTEDGKFFAKLYPATEWDGIEFFHDMLVRELGVKGAESIDVKEMVVGGGKIDLDLKAGTVKCHLYGKSTVYGDYDPFALDTDAIASEIQEVFDLGDTPVDVVTDYEQ